MSDQSDDFVVIGSGIIGSLVARKFAQAGASVTILEAGPRVTRGELVSRFRNSPRRSDWMSPYPPSPWASHPHNPFVPNGVAPFVEHFEAYFKEHPKSHVVFSHIVAESDLVVLHLNSKADERDLGRAIADIFRVENGKIVEHWDVAQSVPDKTARGNTMF